MIAVTPFWTNRLSIYRPDGSAEQRDPSTPDDLSSTLRNNFNINLPQGCEGVGPRGRRSGIERPGFAADGAVRRSEAADPGDL